MDDGSVVLDENKSDDPRSWALDLAVVRALDAFKPDGAQPSNRVFIEAYGASTTGTRWPRRFASTRS